MSGAARPPRPPRKRGAGGAAAKDDDQAGVGEDLVSIPSLREESHAPERESESGARAEFDLGLSRRPFGRFGAGNAPVESDAREGALGTA